MSVTSKFDRVPSDVWLLELNGSPPGSPASPVALFLSFSLSLGVIVVVVFSASASGTTAHVGTFKFWLKASARASPVDGESPQNKARGCAQSASLQAHAARGFT